MLDEAIHQILATLERVRALGVETFGSDAHEFALDPPLSEEELAAHEAAIGLRLPEDYRRFLLLAGASGAGPYYGLVPPDRWGLAQLRDRPLAEHLADPCPFEPSALPAPREEAAEDEEEDEDEAEEERDEELYPGTIALADQGCANYVTLVVRGPARGRILYVSLDGGDPFFPEDTSFLAWYQRWLDELAMGFEHFWFGTCMPGTEDSFRAIVATPDHPRRADALDALSQVLRPQPDTARAVVAALSDPRAAVRQAALKLVRERGLGAAAEAEVRAATADPDPKVRAAALEGLRKAGLNVETEALAALQDPSDAVAAAAVKALSSREGGLGEALTLQLLDSDRAELRREAIASAPPCRTPPVLDRLLALARSSPPGAEGALMAVISTVRQGRGDQAQERALLALLQEQIAAAEGPAPPSAAIHGLKPLVERHPEALATLVALLTHAQPFFRWTALAALSDVGDASVLSAVAALTEDPAQPRAPFQSTTTSVGEQAQRAFARIQARVSGG